VLKVNIDGAFVIKENMGAQGFVVRSNDDGQAVMAGAGKLKYMMRFV
jgi:hypothetical protein